MLVFEQRGKQEYLPKNLSEQRREPSTNSTQLWDLHLDHRSTLNSIRQTDVDTLMIRTQSRVRVRVWVRVRVRVRVRVTVRVIYLNQTGIRHQILGGVEVRVMHSRSDAPSSTPTHSILNCFFP